MRKLKTLIILTLCVISLTSKAQQSDKTSTTQQLFAEGLSLFQQKAFAASVVPLQMFLEETEKSGFGAEAEIQRHEAEYMLACTTYELAQPDRTTALQNFIINHPDSHHNNRVMALLASAYFYEHDYESALDLFNQADLSLLEDQECYDMLYQRATAYMDSGNTEEAAVWYRTLKEISPKHTDDCTYYLAYIDYSNQQYDKALQGFQSVKNNTKYQDLVPYYIGEIFLTQQNYADAKNVAQDYLNQHGEAENAAEMHRIIGSADYFSGNYLDAMKQLESYIDSDDSETHRRDALYMLGMSYFQNGAYSKVPATLGQVTDDTDAMAQNAYLHSGLAYLQLAEKNRARMAFQQAAASDADTQIKEQAAYNYALSVHDTSYSAFGESVTAFEQFLNDFPNSQYADQASEYLVDVYTSTRSYEAALKSIERIKSPNRQILQAKTRILFQLGTQAFANTNFGQAIDYFSQSANTAQGLGSSAQSYLAEALYWRGESYYRIGEIAKAAKDYNNYLAQATNKNDQTYALAHYNLGYTDFHNKNYSQAQSHFQQFINLEKDGNKQLLADAYNRIGDSYLNRRQFEQAKQNYSKSESMGSNTGDYSYYQLALVAGLQKDYNQKINLLNNLESKYPSSPYVVNGLYEKGRSYVESNNNTQAINTYKQLVSRFPDSPLSRKAAAEIGLLYYQDGNYDQAIAAYKKVISEYPGSEEARLSLRDLRSLYVDTDRVNEFAALAQQMPEAISFQPGEQDSLTYTAAERIFMRGDVATAKNSLTRYLQTYPEGAYRLNAHHYLGQIAKQQNDDEALLNHTSALLEYPNNPYSEEALQSRADIYFKQGQFVEALSDYERLQAKASTAAIRQTAEWGMVRSAAQLNDDIEVINAATALLNEAKISPEMQTEALYHRAKAYLNQKADAKATADLQLLATDTRTVQGAESRYLLAQQLYDHEQYDDAEKALLQFIDESTPHAYWLARGFVLLSDVYAQTGKTLEAREYLLSLQQNYQADDDIQTLINERLGQLK